MANVDVGKYGFITTFTSHRRALIICLTKYTLNQYYICLYTIAALSNAHAFESAHSQSYVIAHKLLICHCNVVLR